MSSINPNNIDGTYPIAGQDNDSQGFRDNFTNIKNNFTFAYDELTDLQSKAVLKSALNGSTLDNTLTYTSLNTSGNVLATGLSVFGNVVHAGGRRETGYQFSAPTANVAVTALPTKSRLLLTPTGAIISFGANVTLPGGNVDGTTYSISSNVATTLSVQASNGTSVDPYGNVQLVAGTAATYLYYATATKWFKID